MIYNSWIKQAIKERPASYTDTAPTWLVQVNRSEINEYTHQWL